jgi:1,4-dihydroxy-2-naphthoate polyprenyltransferase
LVQDSVKQGSEYSQLKIWLLAIRPKTLPASIVPVLIGLKSASEAGYTLPVFLTFVVLCCAVCIQITTNFVNDLYDFKKGSDDKDRLGFLRVTQAGLVTESQMQRACYVTIFIALLLGAYIVSYGGMLIVIIGILSLLAAVAYTAGPFPLAYHGLGDISAFFFFGPVAVCGTYYLFSSGFSGEVALYSTSPGLITTAILIINNLRDVHSDKRSGKLTLAVRFGETFTRYEYMLCMIAAFLVPFSYQYTHYGFPGLSHAYYMLLFPGMLFLVYQVFTNRSKAMLNKTLEYTGKLLASFGVLWCIG